MNFIQYARENNIDLLKDDVFFIRKMILSLSKSERRSALKDYVNVWIYAMSVCNNAAKKQNEGRKAANLYLLGIKNAVRHSEMV